MSMLAGLFTSGRHSPPFVELSTISSGYNNPSFDDLHEDPRRHHFTPDSAKKGGQDLPYKDSQRGKAVDKRLEQLPHIKMEERMSSISNAPRHKQHKAPRSSELLKILKSDIHSLLEQALPDSDHNGLVNIICASTTPGKDSQYAEGIIELGLRQEPLGEKDRKDLISSILSRVYNYQFSEHYDSVPPTTDHPTTVKKEGASTSKQKDIPPIRSVEEGFSNLSIVSASQGFRSRTSAGRFVYHTTTSLSKIKKPPPTGDIELNAGDLFIHICTGQQPSTRQVWLYNTAGEWEDITEVWEKRALLVHPTKADRFLTVRDDLTPNWILRASLDQYQSSRSRRGQSRSGSIA
ncbi:hypothetical protein C8R43DRAFT_1047854 [Mycena crocata]|nr:hypothetical protein C8R43DRAFT_1047854 [Mycena crocata]